MRRNEPSVARLFEGEARVSKPQVNESIKKQTGGSFTIPLPVTEFTVFYIFTIDNLGLLRYNKLKAPPIRMVGAFLFVRQKESSKIYRKIFLISAAAAARISSV